MGEMEKAGEKRGAKVDGDKRRIRERRQRNKKTTRKRGEMAALYGCLREDGRLFFESAKLRSKFCEFEQ